MRKTLLVFIITLLFTSLFCQSVFADNELSILLDGQKVELITPHIFKANRTMVTIDSGIFEMIGSEVQFDETEKKVWIEGKYSKVELTINEPVAYIHRKYDFTGIPLVVEMDVAPFIDNGKIYVPLRFALEGLDKIVDWDGLNKAVLITSGDNQDIIPVETPVEYKEINLQEISGELADWVEANRKARGIQFKVFDNKTYILICTGEKPTGGYSIQLDSVTMVAPGSVYITAQVISPSPDMMVIQVLTYPCKLIAIDDDKISQVDGTINSDTIDVSKDETITTVGAAISLDDVSDIALFNLMDEKIKTYAREEYPALIEAFNNAKIDDSFYIMLITGNKLVISLEDGTAIQMTSYGSETNIVALMSKPDGEASSWHLVSPEIAKILLSVSE